MWESFAHFEKKLGKYWGKSCDFFSQNEYLLSKWENNFPI